MQPLPAMEPVWPDMIQDVCQSLFGESESLCWNQDSWVLQLQRHRAASQCNSSSSHEPALQWSQQPQCFQLSTNFAFKLGKISKTQPDTQTTDRRVHPNIVKVHGHRHRSKNVSASGSSAAITVQLDPRQPLFKQVVQFRNSCNSLAHVVESSFLACYA